MDSVFSQLCVLGSSLVLIFGLILLWRRGVTAYITRLHSGSPSCSRWLTAVVALLRRRPRAVLGRGRALPSLKAVVIPRLLQAHGAPVRGGARAASRT